jgi:hypothetical protein
MAIDDPWLVDMRCKGMMPYLEEFEAEIEKEHTGLCEKQDDLSACVMKPERCTHLQVLVLLTKN